MRCRLRRGLRKEVPNSSCMFNYNRKKYRFLTPVNKKNDESILERPEFMYPDPKSGKDKKTDTTEMVNYLRKPRSEAGGTALFAAAVALLLTFLSGWLMVRSLGNPPLNVSAVAFSAMIFSAFAVLCGLFSFLERDKDHLFSLLGISIGGLVLVTWVITILMGMTV